MSSVTTSSSGAADLAAERPLHVLSVAELGTRLRDGTITSTTLTEHALARVAALDPHLHAFIRVTPERALADAARADEELRRGVDHGPMNGIPYALKDIYDTAGIPTTCNSKLCLDRVPSADATAAAKLRDGGGVLLGKLNTHEFALGGPTPDLPFPAARNPWSPRHFTGGSSSGSGAAVAASFVRVALGSDTGGSIRSPACHCGVVGLKPTYGRVSRRGVYPLSYALDHCGPITWSVEDCALAMNVIAGYDPLDPSSVDVPVPDFTAQLEDGVGDLRIAYARCFFDDAPGISPEVIAALDGAAQRLAKLGAVVDDDLDLPPFELFKACGRIIMLAEAYAIHERDLKERPNGYGAYTYERIAPAAGLSAADLTQAFRLRRELTVRLDDLFDRFDALITTTSIAPAAPLSDFPPHWPPPSVAVAVQTAAFNVTGHPALAIPIGFATNELPLGMQIVGRPFDEMTVLRIGAAFEAAAGVTRQRPRLGDA